MNTLSKTCVISINPDVVCTEVDQQLIMLEPSNTVFCDVNPMGATLWGLLEDKALSLDALCHHIHQHYEVTQTQCAEDVRQFIHEMVALNLLHVNHDEKLVLQK